MYLLYNILAYLCMPMFFFRLWWRSQRTPKRWVRWQERCGYAPILNESIWIHAVSLGETLAAVPLIKKIIATYPHTPILVTNMTLTGSEQVTKQLKNTVHNVYIPFDVSHFVTRFLNRTHPKIAIILETELWPNLFKHCQKRNIPIILTNARLSHSSVRAYERFFASMARSMLESVTLIACQSQQDGEHFLRLGLDREKLHITGNIKFDIELSEDQKKIGQQLKETIGDRFIWVAASTHDSEEELMLAAHKCLLKENPNALLILVPRHPERFNNVSTLLEKEDWAFSRRSLNDPIRHNTKIYLADTLGEMMAFFFACDVAVVAGSFKPIGGHNVLEPAALSKAVISGPIIHNFSQAVDLLKASDAIDVVDNNPMSLANALCSLAKNENLRASKGQRALKVVEANRGAINKQFALIQKILN